MPVWNASAQTKQRWTKYTLDLTAAGRGGGHRAAAPTSASVSSSYGLDSTSAYGRGYDEIQVYSLLPNEDWYSLTLADGRR